MKGLIRIALLLISAQVPTIFTLAQTGVNISFPYAVDLFGEQYSPEKLSAINEAYHLQLRQRNFNYDENRNIYEQQISHWIASQNTPGAPKSLITIPVVVHIVYHSPIENISDAQVFSQMVVLNEDFTRSAADTVNTPPPFAAIAANPHIEFCLATHDPSGNPTTGIERRYTNDTIFSFNDNVKYYNTGGLDAWDVTRYINIWVCNTGGVCWGEFPSSVVSNTYGVVMHYIYMGSDYTQYGYFPVINWYYDRGELAVHELGHVFNLRHIWGDDGTACTGSDSCADTPNQQGPSSYCPTFPLYDSCTSSGNGIMFNNFMDYSDDDCYNLFTIGQSARMWAVLGTPPYNSLAFSNACASSGIIEENSVTLFSVSAVSEDNKVTIKSSVSGMLRVFAIDGRIMMLEKISKGITSLDLSFLNAGIYLFILRTG